MSTSISDLSGAHKPNHPSPSHIYRCASFLATAHRGTGGVRGPRSPQRLLGSDYVLLPLYIGGRGPFNFLIDTGAAAWKGVGGGWRPLLGSRVAHLKQAGGGGYQLLVPKPWNPLLSLIKAPLPHRHQCGGVEGGHVDCAARASCNAVGSAGRGGVGMQPEAEAPAATAPSSISHMEVFMSQPSQCIPVYPKFL